jgi:DNA-binding MarR family transcriptional regulator
MIPKDFDNVVIPWLGRTSKVLEHHVDALLVKKGFNLTKMQFILLHKLHGHDGACQSDLAFMSNRNKSSLARAITLLEKKNYIARIPSKADKRINQLYLTKLGHEIIDQTTPIFAEIAEIAQKGLTETEIKTVINILKKIQDNVNVASLVTTKSI